MNLLFVGGSNSVMNPGYVSYTLDHLRAAGHEILSHNISVGANNCLIGLEQVRLFGDLSKIDKVVIEFAVNDYKMVTPRSLQTWQRGYEGLIRYILSQNPHVEIYNLLLAPRDTLAPRIARLRQGLQAITRHYARGASVFLVDFDAYLRRRVDNNPAELRKFYEDSTHYRRPKGAAVVARYLAHALMRQVVPVPARLPPALCANTFDASRLYDLSAMDHAVVRDFRNSRFQRRSHQLMPGQKLVVNLPGPLITLSFLATSNSQPLLIEEEDEAPVFIYTAHASMVPTPHKFLIKNFVLGGRQWSIPGALGPRKVTLTAIDNQEVSEPLKALLADRNNMIPPSDQGGAVYLSNLLYFTPTAGEATAFRDREAEAGMAIAAE
ncbi:SGNH/GDSL hydrolase family protein [Ancylobacter oerskovii]|uniref:SGNH/GDSL hydrolase family protein n=1 Tax=Ancylobacter oerskovii TaxID=459519 RepID=A0ABW4Z048_9HYPH|nr:SGNH/GDSL hydrolase family protein [Ancylobacter oerskovii]MBS7542998.1 hypothetical protein [Ancylobacter oerskovii]